MKLHSKITGRIAALLFSGAATLLAGCNLLDKEVMNAIPEDEWWQTYNQLNDMLNTIYKTVPGGTLMYGDYGLADPSDGNAVGYPNIRIEQEAITDNCIGTANYLVYTSYDSGTIPTNDDKITNVWKTKWKSIRRACRFLENYHRATVAPDRVERIEQFAAEARALRAYYHMELFLFFGEIPIVSSVTGANEQYMARRPSEEIVEWICSEFELAARTLPVRSSAEKWRFTQGACYAWMSYLYLAVGDWANAKKWASEVIDTGVYKLFRSTSTASITALNETVTAETALAESYARLFTIQSDVDEGTNNEEAIFLKNRGMRQARTRLAPKGGPGGGSVCSPTASLVNEYELLTGETLDEISEERRQALIKDPKAEPRDPRMAMSILFPNEKFINAQPNPWVDGLDGIGKTDASHTGYWIKKWANYHIWSIDKTEQGGLDHFYLMRYAVVLLNYVEAAIELGEINDPKIYEYLNDIRDRAGMPDVDETKYNTQEKLRELVRRERRVELAFEGHRLIDIRRWKIGKEVMNGTVYGAWDPRYDRLYEAKRRMFNDRDYLWPIPSNEIAYNPNMVQNPGY